MAGSGQRGIVIAVDGPSGVGKSTVSQALAKRLGFRYVDTGAMYRAVALAARRKGVSVDDPEGLRRIGEALDMEWVDSGDRAVVRLAGEDVTRELRLPGVGEEASRLSRFPEVREVLVQRQREMGAAGNVVMEGRDIGTVVFPDAELKIFLEAKPEERVRRRRLQWNQEGILVQKEEIAREIAVRDERDQSRKVAPLVPSRDAVRIDTTHLSPDQVLDRILRLLSEKGLVRDGR